MSKDSRIAYNEIDITEDDVAKLWDMPTTEEATTPQEEVKEDAEASQPVESTEEPVEATSDEVIDSPPVASDKMEIDGVEYDLETIQSWKKDSTNKTDWQKSNTEKAQKLSRFSKLADELNTNEEFREHMKSYFFDNPDEVNKFGLGDKIELDEPNETVEESHEVNPLEERLSMLEEIENDRLLEKRVEVLDSQLTTLEKKYPEYLSDEKSKEFLDFAEANATRFLKDGMPDLNSAFKEWSYDAMLQELAHLKKLDENRERNKDAIIETSKVGAKETVAPKKYKSVKDIQFDDVAHYFKK